MIANVQRENPVPLRESDLRPGLRIRSILNPRWGWASVSRPTPGVPGSWELRTDRGLQLLSGREARFWEEYTGKP